MLSIRPGRGDDFHAVQAFCQSTFHWGDYIPEVYMDWVGPGPGQVLVAELDGKVVGLVHVAMPTETEAWFEGMRVHSEFRRQRLALSLTEAALDLARRLGARVVRLVIDGENLASQQLAARAGFRLLCRMEEYLTTGTEGHARRAVENDLGQLAELAVARSWLPGRPALVGVEWQWWEATYQSLGRLVERGLLWTNGEAWAVLDPFQYCPGEITVHTPTGHAGAVFSLVAGMLGRAPGEDVSRARVVVPAAQGLVAPGWEGPEDSEYIYEYFLEGAGNESWKTPTGN